MKSNIQVHLPKQIIVETSSENLYIVDYKNINGGGVELLENEPSENYVHLKNEGGICVCFTGFKDNALEIETGFYSQQCECVVFPDSCVETDWVLFIECKYSKDLKTASDVKNGYPKKMIDQVVESVKYFRRREIIGIDKRVNGILAIPTLMEEFSAFMFSPDLFVEILLEHKVKIRAANSAIIKSEKRITI
ncbi:hypothetical protein [Flavobacterium sp. RS13.1]|uniref:hypothetical protein n=1 Tax=Flavobacterium sp. RS13.1 TaxID=3400345 RepID=UPI003AABAC38